MSAIRAAGRDVAVRLLQETGDEAHLDGRNRGCPRSVELGAGEVVEPAGAAAAGQYPRQQIAVYRCYNAAEQHHSASSQSSCDYHDAVKWLLGWALAS